VVIGGVETGRIAIGTANRQGAASVVQSGFVPASRMRTDLAMAQVSRCFLRPHPAMRGRDRH
jgi:NADPH-dependent glutamate synthase beta subunit-like oxidoreductase